MPKKQKPKANSKVNEPVNKIEPGMVVEATRGDLGEEDISKPKVVDVVQDQQGNAKNVVVEKGALFRKKLEIPADRIQAVEQEPEDEKTPGKVTVDVGEKELEQLKPVGVEELPQEGALDEVERKIPTAEGIREMEASKRTEAQSRGREAAESLKTQQQAKPTSFWESQPWCWLRLLYCFSMGWQLDKEVRHVRARDSLRPPSGGRDRSVDAMMIFKLHNCSPYHVPLKSPMFISNQYFLHLSLLALSLN